MHERLVNRRRLLGGLGLGLGAALVAGCRSSPFAPDFSLVKRPSSTPFASSPPTTRAAPTNRPATTISEPAPAAAFMAVFARGDERAAERLASAICRSELASRSGTGAPVLLVPDVPVAQQLEEWARFEFIGAAADGFGFAHLLYVGQPLGGDGVGAPAVWRVDVTPEGRVIWIELVWLFTAPGRVVPADVARDLDPAAFPDDLAALKPRALVGARSAASREAYYLAATPVDGPPRVISFAVDSDGQFRPGVWSFGAVPEGPQPDAATPVPPLTAEQARMLDAYLQAIG